VRKIAFRSWRLNEILLSLGVLGLLLAYTYAFLFWAPYSGFYFNSSNGQVLQIYAKAQPTAALVVGDVLEKIGPLPWSGYLVDANQTLFEEIQPGQVVNITVRRNGLELTVPWVFAGFNRPEFISRLFNIWWLAYFFWLFGVAAQVFVRPKDARWRLLIAADYLTAFWIIAGNLSAWHVWGSSVLLHAVTWLGLPVYLHLHWIFPKPLRRVPNWVWGGFYFTSAALAAGQLLQLLPGSFYLLGFLLMLTGSLTLLGVHSARQPEGRRDVGLLAIAILIAVAPSVSLGIIRIFGSIPQAGTLALLALPVMPGAYFYAIYRRQLGGLELRADRVIAFFIYGVLLLTLSIPIAFAIGRWFDRPETLITAATLATLLIALASVVIYPSFQRWVEHRVLGMPLPPSQLLELYTARIITSIDTEQLKQVICNEVLPSLLIRESALLRLDEALSPVPIYTSGVTDKQLPSPAEIPALLAESGRLRRVRSEAAGPLPCPWARLVLALTLEGKPVGLCLLGRRDPDDFYAPTEIPVLQALMDQTALALMNIEQSERLLALYKVDMERQEVERSRLALELHDDVLGQMALLSMSVGDAGSSSQFDEAYQAATRRIREIITGLRPTMLSYGLGPALDELADEAATPGTSIILEIKPPASEVRYDPMIELHLFRIVQQACQNALQHAEAKTIRITGLLKPEGVDLITEDDGRGFATGVPLDLAVLLANKHFGLAGMYERAALTGAKMSIASTPGGGTRVRVVWHPDRGTA